MSRVLLTIRLWTFSIPLIRAANIPLSYNLFSSWLMRIRNIGCLMIIIRQLVFQLFSQIDRLWRMRVTICQMDLALLSLFSLIDRVHLLMTTTFRTLKLTSSKFFNHWLITITTGTIIRGERLLLIASIRWIGMWTNKNSDSHRGWLIGTGKFGRRELVMIRFCTRKLNYRQTIKSLSIAFITNRITLWWWRSATADTKRLFCVRTTLCGYGAL